MCEELCYKVVQQKDCMGLLSATGEWSSDYFAIDCTASQLADMTRAEGEGRGNVVLANKH